MDDNASYYHLQTVGGCAIRQRPLSQREKSALPLDPDRISGIGFGEEGDR